MTRTKLALFAALALMAPLASAGMIEITMAGTDLTYSDPDGNGGNPGSLTTTGGGADSLASLTFSEDSSVLDVINGGVTPLSFDLSVLNIPAIALPGSGNSTAVTAPAGGTFDLYISNSPVLSLSLDEVEVVYSTLSVGSFNIRVMFAGSVGAIDSQALPNGIELGEPVTLTFNLQTGVPTSSGGYLTGYVGSGSGTISAERIPEPSTLLIAGLGGLLAVAGVRARAKK